MQDNFIDNVLSILQWESEKLLHLLRQPVDKEKWTTEPAVVNAFYNPNKNDIGLQISSSLSDPHTDLCFSSPFAVFPAGILQPLFYSQHFPKSLNYGGIGVVIGHEITHGFDDKGRQFDKEGNMMQWWNNATIEAFRERTQCVIDQYSRYKINEVNMYMDGRMTQGENIADNGGLKQAFRVSIYIYIYKYIQLILIFIRSIGLQEVGEATRQGAAAAGAEYDARSVIFSQLCANLVWIDATGGCVNENPILRAFARFRARSGAALEFA